MSLLLKDGVSRRTFNFEEIGIKIDSLEVHTKRYDHHIGEIVTGICNDFKSAQSEFKNNVINECDYLTVLKNLKYYFDRTPPPYHPSLNAKEIIEEIAKHKIV